MTALFLLLSFAFSALVAWLMIPRIILISFRKKLFDVVDERKVHHGIVPRLGGVAFVPSMTFSLALLFGIATLAGHGIAGSNIITLRLTLGLCALLLLYFEGVTDDLIGIGYKTKFVVQFLCAGMIVASDVYINNFFGLFGLYELPWWIGMPFSVVLVVYLINAVNLIDGIDGLASGLSIVALFFLGILNVSASNLLDGCIAFAMLGCLCTFFYYNVFGNPQKHNKIFMGDGGSQIVGLVLGYLAIHYAMQRPTTPLDGSSLIVAFSVLAIPALDVIRVMMGRMRRGNNPFLPDKTHIHHKFLGLGMSHRTAMLTILTLDTCLVLINLGLMGNVNINIVFLIDVLLFTALQSWLSYLLRRRAENEQQLQENESEAE